MTIEPNGGVRAELNVGDGGTLRLFSEPAKGRHARQVANDLLNQIFPDAVTSYELPNAILGYQPGGYGEVADDWPKGTAIDSQHQRIIIIVAVKNDLALVAGAVGPFHQFGPPDDGPGPPSAANLDIAKDMGKYVNSFMWRGDPRDSLSRLVFQSCTAFATAIHAVSQPGCCAPESCTAHMALSTARTTTQARARSSSNSAASTRV